MRKTKVFFLQLRKLWSEDDTTGVTRPVFDVKCGIVDGEIVVACVSKDCFNEIERADKASWCEKVNFHAALWHDTFNFWDNDWTHEQRDQDVRFIFLV